MIAKQSASTAKIEFVIKPQSGLAALDLKLLWQFRELLYAFADRDIRLRYRQTVLGIAWVVLQPLLTALIFAIVFGYIARMPDEGTPYFLIAYSGLLGWTLFNSNLSRVSPSLVANGALISKIYFPRLLIPLGVVPSVLLDFIVSLGVMVGVLVFYGRAPGVGIFLLPVCALILILMSLGIGLISASLSVKYRDIQHIMPFLTLILIYASPVAYSLSVVPENIRPYYLLNPIAAPIDAIRWSFIGVGEPNYGYLGYSFAVSILLVWIGITVFRSMEREFADVI